MDLDLVITRLKATLVGFKAIGGADWRARMSEALEKTSRAS